MDSKLAQRHAQSRMNRLNAAYLLMLVAVSLMSCALPNGSTGTRTNALATREPIATNTTSESACREPPSAALQPFSTSQLPPAPDWQTRWLRGIPCAPPCWEGVTPGQTSATEAATLLRASPVISNVRLYEAGSSYYGSILWDWTDESPGGGAEYDTEAPQRTITRIAPGFGAYYRLGDVIQAYGEPSHVVARRRRTMETIETGRIVYDLHYVYMSYGFELWEGRYYEKPVLTADDRFVGLTFFTPTLSGYSDATGIPAEILVPWQGFTSYDAYCRDERTLKPCD